VIKWAICKSVPCARQVAMPASYHSVLQARCPSCYKQQCQSSEGTMMLSVKLYIINHNPIRGVSSHGHRQHAQKISWNLAAVFMLCVQTYKHTDKPTYSLQYFKTLLRWSNKQMKFIFTCVECFRELTFTYQCRFLKIISEDFLSRKFTCYWTKLLNGTKSDTTVNTKTL